MNCLLLDSDECRLYSGSDDKTIKVWNLIPCKQDKSTSATKTSASSVEPKPLLLKTLTGHTGAINAIVVSPPNVPDPCKARLYSASADKSIE